MFKSGIKNYYLGLEHWYSTIINLGWYCSTIVIFLELQDQVMGHFYTLMLKYTNIYHMAVRVLS